MNERVQYTPDENSPLMPEPPKGAPLLDRRRTIRGTSEHNIIDIHTHHIPSQPIVIFKPTAEQLMHLREMLGEDPNEQTSLPECFTPQTGDITIPYKISSEKIES